ncbi:MAG: hypothetical protein HY912_24465 [Desulfomonile tiedjei]|uniref:Uncharacterized protein n=1 Tax=Desulfomonile tiedjei TaxID=2358 RepID=A0A9D6V6U5_9BACT|nr:hypothetical protein [Desulfomonile tiedjei]
MNELDNSYSLSYLEQQDQTIGLQRVALCRSILEVSAVKKPVYAWVLLVCYGITLGTAAFHSHECSHERLPTDGEVLGSVAGSAAGSGLVNTLHLFHALDAAELCSTHHCCVHPCYGDCRPAQLFPNGRRVLGTESWQDQAQILTSPGEPRSDFGVVLACGRFHPLDPTPPLASILTVRLLI